MQHTRNSLKLKGLFFQIGLGLVLLINLIIWNFANLAQVDLTLILIAFLMILALVTVLFDERFIKTRTQRKISSSQYVLHILYAFSMSVPIFFISHMSESIDRQYFVILWVIFVGIATMAIFYRAKSTIFIATLLIVATLIFLILKIQITEIIMQYYFLISGLTMITLGYIEWKITRKYGVLVGSISSV